MFQQFSWVHHMYIFDCMVLNTLCIFLSDFLSLTSFVNPRDYKSDWIYITFYWWRMWFLYNFRCNVEMSFLTFSFHSQLIAVFFFFLNCWHIPSFAKVHQNRAVRDFFAFLFDQQNVIRFSVIMQNLLIVNIYKSQCITELYHVLFSVAQREAENSLLKSMVLLLLQKIATT